MGKSARLPDLDEEAASPLLEALGAVGGALARNPTLVGGTTAFVVALAYVSANALWYQPHFHSGAFFATRAVNYVGPPDPSTQETTIKIEREGAARPKPNPVVERVQAVLASMNLYEGKVDGFNGPNTRKAIETYRKTLGLAPSSEIDDELLQLLGAKETTAGITPKAATPDPVQVIDDTEEPAISPEKIAARIEGEEAPAAGDPVIMKIQAGLKAFGHDKMEIDGVIGSRTRAAIKEFESLFGLPVTGEPSEQLYAKMREIGLTN